jgi:iron complex outermembrane recepter protein
LSNHIPSYTEKYAKTFDWTAGLMPLFLRRTGSCANPGLISGRVVSDSGGGLAGISVKLDETAQPATTAADGRFTISDLPPGKHTLTIAGGGFVPLRREVEINAGETATQDA